MARLLDQAGVLDLYRAGQGQRALKSVHRDAQIAGGHQYGGAATDTVPTT